MASSLGHAFWASATRGTRNPLPPLHSSTHLEQVVARHPGLARHTCRDDHQVAARQRFSKRLGPFVADRLALGVDVADVGGDALGAGDIVEGEVGDVGVHLLGFGRGVFFAPGGGVRVRASRGRDGEGDADGARGNGKRCRAQQGLILGRWSLGCSAAVEPRRAQHNPAVPCSSGASREKQTERERGHLIDGKTGVVSSPRPPVAPKRAHLSPS